MTSTQSNAVCEFCGRKREPIIVTCMKEVHVVGYRQCSCEGAVAKRQEEEAEERKKQHEERIRKFYDACRKAGIPKRYLKAKTDRDDLFQLIEEGTWLYIDGPVETGKTYLAMALAKRAIFKGIRTRVTSSVQIMSEIYSSFSSDETELSIINSLSSPDLLVIDDMGKDDTNKRVVRVLYQVINERYNEMKTTVITSNYTLDKLGERLVVNDDEITAEAIIRRIGEEAKFEHLTEPVQKGAKS